MTWVGWLGVVLIGVSVVAVLGCLAVVVLPAGLRVRRVALVTDGLVTEYSTLLQEAQWSAREHALERALLLRPARRIQRVLTHPLVVALLESYRRRRARARERTA